jgi:hypothetical protein
MPSLLVCQSPGGGGGVSAAEEEEEEEEEGLYLRIETRRRRSFTGICD